MSKASKIRRYRRKNYASEVEFPVEIIGRDGVVRRFSFEESVRLYQRRVASADLRYGDRELIAAEKQHCLSRIGQLRRSFFASHGWPELQVVDQDSGPTHLLAAEVAAFLRRCLVTVSIDPERFSISLLEVTSEHQVYFIQPPNDELLDDALVDGHFLLYVFRFDTQSGCPNRDAFFELIKVLDGVSFAARVSVESLISFFHTHDCGLVLTGFGSLVQQARDVDLAQVEGLSWGGDEADLDLVMLGMQAISRGNFSRALAHFVEAYTQQNFRRVAYLGAAVMADMLGSDDEAVTATVMGSRYFPDDPALEYHGAVTKLRQGQYALAVKQARGIQGWPQGSGAIGLVVALGLLADRQDLAGRSKISEVMKQSFLLDPHLERGARFVRSQLWARDLMLFSTVLIGLGALGAAWKFSFWWGLGIPAAIWAYPAVIRSWHRQLLERLHGQVEQRIRLSSSAILLSDQPGLRLQ
jgi:hypothetical protein